MKKHNHFNESQHINHKIQSDFGIFLIKDLGM